MRIGLCEHVLRQGEEARFAGFLVQFQRRVHQHGGRHAVVVAERGDVDAVGQRLRAQVGDARGGLRVACLPNASGPRPAGAWGDSSDTPSPCEQRIVLHKDGRKRSGKACFGILTDHGFFALLFRIVSPKDCVEAHPISG